MKDPSNSDIALINEYNSYVAQGNMTAARQFLKSNPELIPMCFNADKWNRHENMIIAIEEHYKDEIHDYLLNVVKNKGEYDSSIAYPKYSVVMYKTEGVQEYFLAIADVPIGKTPKSSDSANYWEALTIKGEKGESGAGLTYEGAWDSSVTYSQTQCVSYQGYLWTSLADDNIGHSPITDDGTYWDRIFKVSTEAKYVTFDKDSQTLEAWRTTMDSKVETNASDITTAKSDIQVLNTSVEKNTSDITQLTTNTFNKSDIVPISNGGTGATEAITALNNLGGFKKSKPLDDGTDLDTVIDEGNYWIASNRTYLNAPANMGCLTVYSISSAVVLQVVTSSTGDTYKRSYTNSTWSAWKQYSNTATKLDSSRNFSISGGCTASAVAFNGTENVVLNVSKVNPNYFSETVPISKGGTGATDEYNARNNLGIGKSVVRNIKWELGYTITPSFDVSNYTLFRVNMTGNVINIPLVGVRYNNTIHSFGSYYNGSVWFDFIAKIEIDTSSGKLTFKSLEQSQPITLYITSMNAYA